MLFTHGAMPRTALAYCGETTYRGGVSVMFGDFELTPCFNSKRESYDCDQNLSSV